MTNKLKTADSISIIEAAELLKQGNLVAFPTETVYGLGADASNPEAVEKIFKAKGRPANHPLIVHLGKPEQIVNWAQNIPQTAWDLITKFWPGPLTLVLKKQPNIPTIVTGGQQTIALRIPDNPVALSLLKQFGGGLAAPSANRFNHISPTLAWHVFSELGDAASMILDGGACRVGLESTIIDLTGSQPGLLRPGSISTEQIEAVIQTTVVNPKQAEIRAPGLLKTHYSPTTPTVMCASDNLIQTMEKAWQQNRKIGVLKHGQSEISFNNVLILSLPEEPNAYGQALYAALRQLDNSQLDMIIIEQPPNDDCWLAVNDRLGKATATATATTQC